MSGPDTLPPYDWRQRDKEAYLPGTSPSPAEIPVWKYFRLAGEGEPGDAGFTLAAEMLRAVSLLVQTFPAWGQPPAGWHDFVLFPIEAVWSALPEESGITGRPVPYDLMMRQPAFLTPEAEAAVRARAAAEYPHYPWKQLEEMEQGEGGCLQMLHDGMLEDRGRCLNALEAACRSRRLVRRGSAHKEIYLGWNGGPLDSAGRIVCRLWVRPAAAGNAARRFRVRGRHG